jgi:hypothetical protein
MEKTLLFGFFKCYTSLIFIKIIDQRVFNHIFKMILTVERFLPAVYILK